MKAVCYLRDLPEPSLEAQQRAFLNYCARSGLEVGPTFTEVGAEGTAPEFRRMLNALERERRGFTSVVIAALPVLGARVREQARRYLQLAASGLALQLADGGDADEALLRAWGRSGPPERRRERVREAMRGRALRGEVLGRPPFGYRSMDRHLRVDAAESAVVREIFRACVEEGEGIRRIAGRLNAAGLRTRRGGPWNMASVRDVLRNPVYVGTYRRLGVVVPHAHEPIVERRQFDEVQRLLAERRTSPGRQSRRQYLLAGLARCGYCGNRLIGVRRSRRVAGGSGEAEYVYYQCSSRTNQSRCGYHTRRAEELERIVRERVAAPPRRGKAIEAAAARGGTTAAAEQRADAGRRARLRALDRMLERRASGEWTAPQLRSRAAALALEDLQWEGEQERSAAAGAGGGAEKRNDAARRRALEAARRRLGREWDALDFEHRRALLREVVAAVIAKDDEVQVQFAG